MTITGQRSTIDTVEELFDLEKIHERLRHRRQLLQARQRRLHARMTREAEILKFEKAARDTGVRLPLGDVERRVISLRQRVSESRRKSEDESDALGVVA